MEKIIIKKEFNNGIFDCLEIYHDNYKILEITNNKLWNATQDNPIVIAKSRINDYMVSEFILDNIEDEHDMDVQIEE